MKKYLCLLIFFLSLKLSPAKIHFSSNFDESRTLTADSLSSGQDEINLIQGTDLNWWPENGGRGLIQGENPFLKDSFSYKKRSGLTLLNVKGVKNAHPAHSSIINMSTLSWDESTRNVFLEHANPIHGILSIGVDQISGLYKNFEPMENAWISFTLRFDSRSLGELKEELRLDEVLPGLQLDGRHLTVLDPDVLNITQ